ncbi:hypothetical protein JCM21714_1031 [Gracilibacillus boraciitolerans JCM 21714]|uniref:Uncharacterized protein n=1 Tax=Gracilibacillus boraciitolerans JCM 21714 TaxID=1298598 RepID=W4VFT1_9BACI|nr:hypothetical protein JCM21714_1031 [Gracilibacillus boraciitolerans JCM 21714]
MKDGKIKRVHAVKSSATAVLNDRVDRIIASAPPPKAVPRIAVPDASKSEFISETDHSLRSNI